jgi:predicted nucleic acid-binding protein
MKRIIADSTPLILLAKLALLDILCDRFSVVVPAEVALEATRRQDLADARYIQVLVDGGRLKVNRGDPRHSTLLGKQWGIGKGEAAVLALAKAEEAVLMTDDFAAMRVARVLRLPFTTTPRMIVEFQKQGLISLDAARAKLVELERHAWIGAPVLARMREILEGGH